MPPGNSVIPFTNDAQMRIDDRVAQLISPGDDEALADALTLLAREPRRRKALGAEARRLAELLSWPNIARATTEVYRWVLPGFAQSTAGSGDQ